MLRILALSSIEAERVELVVSWLVAARDQLFVIEELRGQVDDRLVRSMVKREIIKR